MPATRPRGLAIRSRDPLGFRGVGCGDPPRDVGQHLLGPLLVGDTLGDAQGPRQVDARQPGGEEGQVGVGLVGELARHGAGLGEERPGPLDLAQLVPTFSNLPHLEELLLGPGRRPGLECRLVQDGELSRP